MFNGNIFLKSQMVEVNVKASRICIYKEKRLT